MHDFQLDCIDSFIDQAGKYGTITCSKCGLVSRFYISPMELLTHDHATLDDLFKARILILNQCNLPGCND